MNLTNIAFVSFGFLLSINQGFTVILGRLSDGTLRGADVLMPSDLAMYALFFLKTDQTYKSQYRNSIMIIKVLAIFFLLWSITGEFVSAEPAEFRFGFVHLLRAILVFWVVLTRINTRNDVIMFTIGIMLGLGLQSLIGIYQWQIGPVIIPFFTINNTWRSTGTLGPANAFGCYIAALAPVTIRIAIFTPLKPKILWSGISVFAMGSLLATFTRGAWLSFGVSMIIFFLLDFKRKKLNLRQMILVVTVLLVSSVAITVKYGDTITNRMSGSKESMVGEKKHSRLGLAKDAFRVINDHKIFGVGLNNYRFFSDREIQGTRIVHNAYLLITAQQGLPGIVTFLLLHVFVFIFGYKILKSKDPILYHVGVAHLTGLLSMSIYHMIAPDYRLIPILLQHWRIVAILPALVITDERMKKMAAFNVWKRQQQLILRQKIKENPNLIHTLKKKR